MARRSFPGVLEHLESRLLLSGDYGLVWTAGGPASEMAYAIAADTKGSVYVAGFFSGTVDFDAGAGVTNLTSAGGVDIFVAKYNSAGALTWAARAGGAGEDIANALAVDGSGNVFVTGSFQQTVDFNPAAATANLTSAGSKDLFVWKLTSSGNLGWVKSAGGATSDVGNGIALDSSGNIIVAGAFSGTVFFGTGASAIKLFAKGYDAFAWKLDSAGTTLWADRFGGTSDESARAVAVDASDNIALAGQFSGSGDFDPGSGTTTLTSLGGQDIFVAKLNADGTLAWAKSVGGALNDVADDVAIAPTGEVFVTGTFRDLVDFDPGAATRNLGAAGADARAFMWKITAAGAYAYAGQLGSGGTAFGKSITLDRLGNVFVAGHYTGTGDFNPAGRSTSYLTSRGGLDVFVTKLTAGGKFVYARSVGGTSTDNGMGVAVSSSDLVFLTGSFRGTADFDPGTGTQSRSSNGGSDDMFIVKLKQWVPDLGWALGGGAVSDYSDDGNAVATDADGNVYVGGSFHGTVDFDPSLTAVKRTSAATTSGFIAKYSPERALLWVYVVGSAVYEVQVDHHGAVYAAGAFTGTQDFSNGQGPTNLVSAGEKDAFVVKLNSSASLVWARRVGGKSDDLSGDLVLDSNHNVYLGGYFGGTADFDPGAGTANLTSAGSIDVYVLKLDPSGNYLWSRRWGGTESDFINGMQVANGYIYTAGGFTGTADFDPGSGTFNLTGVASYLRSYVSMLDTSGGFVRAWASSGAGSVSDYATGLALDSSGFIYVCGNLQGTRDFDPSTAVQNLSTTNMSPYIAKYSAAGKWVWGYAAAASQTSYAGGIAIDSANNVYITGLLDGAADFDPSPIETHGLADNASQHVFLWKLTYRGEYVWAGLQGGTVSRDLALSPDGAFLYDTGTYAGPADFDPGAGTYDLSSVDNKDFFVAKFAL